LTLDKCIHSRLVGVALDDNMTSALWALKSSYLAEEKTAAVCSSQVALISFFPSPFYCSKALLKAHFASAEVPLSVTFYFIHIKFCASKV